MTPTSPADRAAGVLDIIHQTLEGLGFTGADMGDDEDYARYIRAALDELRQNDTLHSAERPIEWLALEWLAMELEYRADPQPVDDARFVRAALKDLDGPSTAEWTH